jgi:hypothetical protein
VGAKKQRKGGPIMPDVASLLEAVQSVFPLLTIIVSTTVILGIAGVLYRHLKDAMYDETPAERERREQRILQTAREILAIRDEKPKNDLNLALLDQPQKPKRMFVRLGDDGELVEWGGEHETNSQV